MTEFIIQDWTGKVCFGGLRFPSFEDGWGYIYENEPDPEAYGEYYVEEVAR